MKDCVTTSAARSPERHAQTVRVRFAFNAPFRGTFIPFFNVIEEGHPLGFMSSVSAKGAAEKGYQIVEEFK